ncbi:MAG: YidH family protein [Sphingomicrobium sp.]
MSDEEKPDKTEMSEQRTEFAEDRTVLANERTFAGWFRTGITAAALGLGFHALFVRMEPWWAPRAIASVFFVLAILVFIVAERRACKVLERLSAHDVKPFGNSWLRWMTILASVGIAALIVALWTLPIEPEN